MGFCAGGVRDVGSGDVRGDSLIHGIWSLVSVRLGGYRSEPVRFRWRRPHHVVLGLIK